jgi:hypothetical protein
MLSSARGAGAGAVTGSVAGPGAAAAAVASVLGPSFELATRKRFLLGLLSFSIKRASSAAAAAVASAVAFM